MLDLAAALAKPIAKLLLKSWLGDTSAEIGTGLFDMAKKRLDGHSKALDAQRKAAAVGMAVAQDLELYFAHERARPDDLEAAAHDLGATIEQHVSAAFLVHQGLDAAAIERALLEARPVEGIYKSAEPAHGYYRQLVAALAPRLRAVAPELPDYGRERDAELLDRLGRLVESAPEILAGLADARADTSELVDAKRQREAQTSSHEEDYRAALRKEVAKLRLFGIDLDRGTPEQWPLSVAYIPLRLSFDEGQRNMAPIEVDYRTALALLPALGNRLLIEGVAGSGKTTLLQWTALQALDGGAAGTLADDGLEEVWLALRGRMVRLGGESGELSKLFDRLTRLLGTDFGREVDGLRMPMARARRPTQGRAEEQWIKRTPFLVRLRDCSDGHLPEPDALPAVIAQEIGKPPEGWVREQLKGGKAMLLFDGVDEVPDTERAAILRSMDRYFDAFPNTFFVTTSRPEALGQKWHELYGPWRAKIRYMTAVDREVFIEHWHEAVRAELVSRNLPPTRIDVEKDAARLNDLIEASPALSKLAETPLLCSAICFLNRARQGDIPGRAVKLYETLCDMLIGRRDRDRFRKQLEGRFSEAYRVLDDQEKNDVLSSIAHFMIGEGKAAIADVDLVPIVEEEIGRRPKQIAVKSIDILKALKERSGVLRGASETESEFAHNGFRSYLAARRFVETGAFGDLLLKAEHTSDPDLPVFAAAMGTRGYGERLIRELEGKIKGRRPKASRRLRVMALRCWQAGGASPELQKAFLRPLMGTVLPPRTFEEAGQVAELGARVIPYLKRKRARGVRVAPFSVRALRLIGGAEADAALGLYLDHASDEVLDELAQGPNPLAIEAIAGLVTDRQDLLERFLPQRHLRDHDLSILPKETDTLNLARSGVRKLDVLQRFRHLAWLSLSGTRVGSLEPLKGLTALQWLYLSNTQVSSVEPLESLVALQSLDLSGTQVSSVEPLAGLPGLQSLDLSGTQVSSVEPLAGLPGLQWLDLSGTQVSSVEPLRGLTALQTLHLNATSVDNLEPLRGLTGLQALSLTGTPVRDVEPLRDLKALQSLSLDGTSVASVEPLRGLMALQTLSLMNMQVSSLEPLNGLTSLGSLYLTDTSVGHLEPLKRLTSLHSLILDGVPISSLEPLRGLTALQMLSVTGTQVSNLEPLKDLTNLRVLWLDGTQVRNLEPLKDLVGLRSLYLSDPESRKSDPVLVDLRSRGVDIRF